jgi:predicted nucleic acid-binding protein
LTAWCIDANVVIATLVDETATPAARGFWDRLRRTDEVVAAQVLHPECIAVLRRKVAQGVISEAEGRAKVEEALTLPITVETSRTQFTQAFAWAVAMKRIKMHDLQYLAVAQIRNATMVTIDGGLRQAALERGVQIRVLE